jgi:hypothetical protein
VEVQELLYKCLNPVPEERPTIDEILKCEWIKDAPEKLDAELTHELNLIMGLQLK